MAGFEMEKKSFETEKVALIQQAEAAEKQLALVTEELVGLKLHITQMTQAIFGKSFLKLQRNINSGNSSMSNISPDNSSMSNISPGDSHIATSVLVIEPSSSKTTS